MGTGGATKRPLLISDPSKSLDKRVLTLAYLVLDPVTMTTVKTINGEGQRERRNGRSWQPRLLIFQTEWRRVNRCPNA